MALIAFHFKNTSATVNKRTINYSHEEEVEEIENLLNHLPPNPLQQLESRLVLFASLGVRVWRAGTLGHRMKHDASNCLSLHFAAVVRFPYLFELRLCWAHCSSCVVSFFICNRRTMSLKLKIMLDMFCVFFFGAAFRAQSFVGFADVPLCLLCHRKCETSSFHSNEWNVACTKAIVWPLHRHTNYRHK